MDGRARGSVQRVARVRADWPGSRESEKGQGGQRGRRLRRAGGWRRGGGTSVLGPDLRQVGDPARDALERPHRLPRLVSRRGLLELLVVGDARRQHLRTCTLHMCMSMRMCMHMYMDNMDMCMDNMDLYMDMDMWV